MSVTPNPDQRVAQLIDANLDRAREGLRVIEDWSRFAIKNKGLVITLKDWRHQLGQLHHESYKESRSINSDKGLGLGHDSQSKRVSAKQIVEANFARVQEALRVLEEFSRIYHPELSLTSSKIRYELYDFEKVFFKLEKKQILLERMNSCKICLITHPHKDLIKIISKALEAGITMVQYRCKESNDFDSISQAKELASLCKKHQCLFIINDRVDIALATNADGVHLGQKDIPIDLARKLIGPEKLIGLSTHSLEEVYNANKQKCDYIGLGPVYKTQFKPELLAIGTELLKEAVKISQIPIFAIGGINEEKLSELQSTGINRIAVIHAIINSKDPFSTSKKLLENLK
ncbi:thiamine phosphate synthase [Prochlorococcus marinus]|uniref:thiamine phosphate synthase n=1 Tax=Prochlorococcus marinus TaxID=1219 RepID=UPI0022B545F1|nr:thiamine phosphate synthase [Prochlorococcus marinus]